MAVPPPPTFEEFGDNIFATPPRKPTLERRGAVADVEKKEADIERGERTLPTTVQTNQAPEGYMWVNPNDPNQGVVPIPGFKKTDKSGQQKERLARMKASLAALQRVRELAEERLAIGSASEFLQNVPLINQNRRNIESAIGNAQSGIISDVVAKLAELNQGGVTGMANTPEEARRLGAQIADLNPNQDLPSLIEQAQRAEDYYLQQIAAIEGKETVDQDLLATYLPENRLLELAATKKGETRLSEDGTKSVEIPAWYQQAHFRYLNENRDNFDPSQYAAWRADLDEKAGFTPDMPAYLNFGEYAKEFFRKGGAPQQLGSVPPVPTKISEFEKGVTSFAQNPVGAATLSAITSATAGLPVALAGGQEKMEAVRQNQPVPSFIGDVIGGAIGTKGLGTTTRIAGLSDNFLANPVLQDAAFNIVSGATQAEDPLAGATSGLVTSLLGEYGGRALGRAMPSTFAPRSMKEARESVPTTGELGEEADRLYRRAAAQGQMMDAPAVDAFIDDTEQFMRLSGLMDQQGNVLGTGPVQDAYRLLSSFRGQPINPIEAQTIRKKIAEGRMAMRDGAPDNTARMFSGELTDRFDDFAEAAMPGIAEAREVAQRRIVGRELERARELGQARGDINYTQGGADLGIRRAYGNLDTAEIRGTRMYPQDVSEAIQVVSRGTPSRNVAQAFGRLSPQGGTGLSGGALLGLLGGTAAGDVATGGLLTGGMYGLGLAGRGLASAGTRRDAELAELIARGGPAFRAMLDDATERASLRAGRFGAGAAGAAGIRPFIDEDFREETPTTPALEDLSARYPEQPALDDRTPKYAGPTVDAAGNEVAPAEAPGPKAGDTIVIDNRDAVYDPVAKAYIFVDTNEIARKVMKRGGAVKGYNRGGTALRDRARSVGQGVTFGFGDEIEGGVRALGRALSEGDLMNLRRKYLQERDVVRAQQKAYEDANPFESLLYEGGGAMLTGLIPGAQGATAARMAQLAARSPKLARAAGVAADTALYGAGTAESVRDIPRSIRDEALFAVPMYGGAEGVRAGVNRYRVRKGKKR
jgi:hypothetical protein